MEDLSIIIIIIAIIIANTSVVIVIENLIANLIAWNSITLNLFAQNFINFNSC